MKCLNCGQEIDVHDIYCNYCGHINKGENQNNINEQNNNVSNNNNIINNNVNNNINEQNINNQNEVSEPIIRNNNKTYVQQNQIHNLINQEPITVGYKYNLIAFLIVNILLYITIVGSASYSLYINNNKEAALNIMIALSIFYFYVICFETILIKADMPWWIIFIPIANIYALYKISFGPGGAILAIILIAISTYIIPVLLLIIDVIYLFVLGKRFGRSGLLTLLLSFVVIPTIAFSSKYQYE